MKNPTVVADGENNLVYCPHSTTCSSRKIYQDITAETRNAAICSFTGNQVLMIKMFLDNLAWNNKRTIKFYILLSLVLIYLLQAQHKLPQPGKFHNTYHVFHIAGYGCEYASLKQGRYNLL